MKYLLWLLAAAAVSSCGRSVHGSGRVISETRNTENFIAVDASGSVKVELRIGDKNSVVVEADDNVIRYVETKVSGNSLNIKLKELTSLTNVTIHVYVTAPRFQEINASASAEITSKDVLTTDNIELKANSSGSITAELDAPKVLLFAESSGEVNVRGRTRNLAASASSSGEIKADHLLAENVKAEAESSGDISVFASISVNASASSSGSVSYTGGAPKVVKEENSSGSVSAD